MISNYLHPYKVVQAKLMAEVKRFVPCNYTRKTASVSQPLHQYGGGSEMSQFPERTRTQTFMCLYIRRGISLGRKGSETSVNKWPLDFWSPLYTHKTR